MTMLSMAAAMRRMADTIEKLAKEKGDLSLGREHKPTLDVEAAAGAAVMLCYLRDLLTVSEKEFDRSSILVLLETISRDPEIFPLGIGRLMWDVEEEEEDGDDD